MSALPQADPDYFLVDVEEVNGRQVVRLPETLHIHAAKLRIVPNAQGWQLEPVSGRIFTDEEWDHWMADLRAFQEELGDLFPEGRNQGVLEPKEIFPKEASDNTGA